MIEACFNILFTITFLTKTPNKKCIFFKRDLHTVLQPILEHSGNERNILIKEKTQFNPEHLKNQQHVKAANKEEKAVRPKEGTHHHHHFYIFDY